MRIIIKILLFIWISLVINWLINNYFQLLKEIENNIYNLSILHQVNIIKKENFITKNAIVYAYNAKPSQTDNTPCLTANQTNACQPPFLIVANNCLKFGSVVEIKGKRYKVADRMNKRYDCQNFDILMATKEEAINFGKQYLTIKIYD